MRISRSGLGDLGFRLLRCSGSGLSKIHAFQVWVARVLIFNGFRASTLSKILVGSWQGKEVPGARS